MDLEALDSTYSTGPKIKNKKEEESYKSPCFKQEETRKRIVPNSCKQLRYRSKTDLGSQEDLL